MAHEAQDLYNLEDKRTFKDVLPIRQEGGDGATQSTLGRLLSAFESWLNSINGV